MTDIISNHEELGSFKGCVLTYGHFSTIHPGHIRYLRHARTLGNKLVIAINGDNNENKYPFNQQERSEALTLLNIADAVLLLGNDEIELIIERLKPKVLVLGNEYKNNMEIQDALKQQRKNGGQVQFHAGEVNYGNAELLNSSEKELRKKRRNVYEEVCNRMNLKKKQLKKAIKEWGKTRLIVIGDIIVDQYTACEALGMSAEAPVVVVKELESKEFVGGAAIVAAHIAALGAQCDLISVTGKDNIGERVREELISLKISNKITIDPSRPTTFKKRYLVENQKLFRVSRLEEKNISTEIEAKLIKQLEELAPKAQGIVVSDFVYGVVTPQILETIQKLARQHNLLLFGDLQCSSQVGSISKFQNYSLLCPNEREARLALQDKDSGLEQISQILLKRTSSERMVMKLGPNGFIAYDRTTENKVISQAFPALSVNPVDVAGAGDSLLALFSTALASKQPMMATAALACCMTAVAVETMGNTPVCASKLSKALDENLQA